MTANPTRDRRELRRETHPPRSGLAIAVAVLTIAACVLLATETVLHLFGQAPLVIAPTDAARAAAEPAPVVLRLLVPLGLEAALIGLLLLLLLLLLLAAVLPGRRSRHSLTTERLAVVFDDEVIASALARSSATAAGVAPDAVRVTVGRGSASIRLTPTSGIRVDEQRVALAARNTVQRIGPQPSIRPTLRVAVSGRVGS